VPPRTLAHAVRLASEHRDLKQRRDEAIRAAYDDGWTQLEIGEAVGLSRRQVSRIIAARRGQQNTR
jgi:DNA-binding transcriptional regulator LsrR (DeoR family)